MSQSFQTKCPARRPVSVWELPKLTTSVHAFRRATVSSPKLRPHFVKILAFVCRNRFAIADQIQRRFPKYLKSDRTARRHLAEMETLGVLGVQPVNGVSPLMPKVFFVTAAGLRCLRRAYEQNGVAIQPFARERRRTEGHSFPHVFHELAITEFLIAVREAVAERHDLELLIDERRSLVSHPAFRVTLAGRRTRLRPDALFQFRQIGGGSMCCFVEIDNGSETERQLAAKLRRYRVWGESERGSDFLSALYRKAAATRVRPVFRVLFVCCYTDPDTTARREKLIARVASRQPGKIASCLWTTTQHRLTASDQQTPGLLSPIWMRVRSKDSTSAGLVPRLCLFPDKE